MDKRLHLSAKNKTDLLPNERVLHAASAGGMDSISQGARITVGIVNRIAPQNAMCKRWDTPIRWWEEEDVYRVAWRNIRDGVLAQLTLYATEILCNRDRGHAADFSTFALDLLYLST